MVVQKRNDVNQEAQDYLNQFKGARSRNVSKSTNSDDSFETMLDTWTREKFQLKNVKKAATRAVNHRHQHHGDKEWDHTVPTFLDDSGARDGPMWTEGELFAEAELDQEQETYMNEEALLEQLLQQEPPKRANKRNNKKPLKLNTHVSNKNKREQPTHSTPKDSMESFQHTANVHELQMDNPHRLNAPVRLSRRGNPPPPPPKWDDGVAASDSGMPSCHHCGWTYTAAHNEVLDLPELLDILTPKAPRKMNRPQQDLLLTVDSPSPPPLPSKPRPPPPAHYKQRSRDQTHHHSQPQQIDNVTNGRHVASHTSHPHIHSQPHSQPDQPYNVFQTVLAPDVTESPVLEAHVARGGSDTLAYSPHYRGAHSPRTPPGTSPRLRPHPAAHSSSRATQTDPNLLPQDLSPMALVDKSSDTDNGRGSKERLFTRAKPPSGPSLRAKNDSFDDNQHLQATEPILEASKRGNLGLMKQILENEHDQLKMRDIQGNNLTHICCERGHLKCVQYLYHHFAYQCEEENKAKFTPAVLTIKGGQADVLDWLLENTQAKDEILPLPNKKSLLHHAAKFGQDGCLRIVLEKLSGIGRLTACCDGNGNSPAHVAAKHGHLSCLQILVEYGMDVTKANKYGHSPCYYADFSNHRQCAGYLMVVETCLNLAKKLIRLEKSMEQLSTSLAKCSGDFSQSEINLPYDYSADKSSATSSVEDDGTRDEAWLLLCRKFEEASKRLVVFRTQNRAIRPLKPTKLAMLALAQTKEEAQAALTVLVNDIPSYSNPVHRHGAGVGLHAANRSRSFPDLLSVQSGEEGTPSTVDRFGIHGSAHKRLDAISKFHHSQPDLTTSDDSTHPLGDFSTFHTVNSESLVHTLPQSVPPYGYQDADNNNEYAVRHRTNSQSDVLQREVKANDVYRYDNDLEYHLKTRVLPPKSSFRPEKYLIQNWQQQSHNASMVHNSTQDQSPWYIRNPRDVPSPPVENETSDFFEDSNGRHDSDTSELDQETLRKIFDMQEEIMRCHPQGAGAELGRARIQTPVKLKLTDQDFKEQYERCEGCDKDESTESDPPILQRYRRVIRPRQPPPEPPRAFCDAPHEALDTMNKSCNNSHTDSLDDSLQSGARLEDTLREESEDEAPPCDDKARVDPSKPWYEMTDDEETKNSREPEEYFTLL